MHAGQFRHVRRVVPSLSNFKYNSGATAKYLYYSSICQLLSQLINAVATLMQSIIVSNMASSSCCFVWPNSPKPKKYYIYDHKRQRKGLNLHNWRLELGDIEHFCLKNDFSNDQNSCSVDQLINLIDISALLVRSEKAASILQRMLINLSKNEAKHWYESCVLPSSSYTHACLCTLWLWHVYTALLLCVVSCLVSDVFLSLTVICSVVGLSAGDTEGKDTHRAHCCLAVHLLNDGRTTGEPGTVHHI